MAAEMTAAERKKLKVQEVRDELEARGLPTDGTKAVLLERLEEAIGQESLQDMPDEEGDDGDGGAEADAEAAQANAGLTPDDDDEVGAEENLGEEEQGETDPTAKQSSAQTSSNAGEPTAQGKGTAGGHPRDKIQARWERSAPRLIRAPLRMLAAGKDLKDAKKSRAERFGLTIKETVSDKKTKRAARFGMKEANGSAGAKPSKAVVSVDDETKKKRMAKFGLSEEETAKLSGPAKSKAGAAATKVKLVKALSEEEKKKREERKARFNVGAPTPMDDKKRQRMERFGMPVKTAKTT